MYRVALGLLLPNALLGRQYVCRAAADLSAASLRAHAGARCHELLSVPVKLKRKRP